MKLGQDALQCDLVILVRVPLLVESDFGDFENDILRPAWSWQSCRNCPTTHVDRLYLYLFSTFGYCAKACAKRCTAPYLLGRVDRRCLEECGWDV